jgi:tRNA 2-selenouridine synthase
LESRKYGEIFPAVFSILTFFKTVSSHVAIDVRDFMSLRETLPLLDVRSEGEFEQGHITSAINLPILNNAERIVVGTTYKQQGQNQAIKEGFRLVGPRLTNIIEEAEKVGKEVIVHCWRGGMRSSNFCQFVGMAGIKTHQIKGGYKAYRQLAGEYFQKEFRFTIIGGCTGSGKSEVLRALQNKGEQVVDLEALANHKGSVFGGLGHGPQPTTEQFQNDLFEVLAKMDTSRRIWIEDESIAVGKIFLPIDFWKSMGQSRIVVLDVDKSERIRRLTHEYGNIEPELFLQAMSGITKKLGGQHFNAARDFLLAGRLSDCIEVLLTYYDRAYNNSMERKAERITARVTWNGHATEEFTDKLIKFVSDEKSLIIEGT